MKFCKARIILKFHFGDQFSCLTIKKLIYLLDSEFKGAVEGRGNEWLFIGRFS